MAPEIEVADQDKIPQVIVAPEAQSVLDADPALAEAFKEIAARLRQAMQSVKDGRYATFDEAAAAVGLQSRPVLDEHGEPVYAGDDEDD